MGPGYEPVEPGRRSNQAVNVYTLGGCCAALQRAIDHRRHIRRTSLVNGLLPISSPLDCLPDLGWIRE